MRTRAVAEGLEPGSTNVVSDRLNCRASGCIDSGGRSAPRSKTQSGLPLNGSSPEVNTLRMRYGCSIAHESRAGARGG